MASYRFLISVVSLSILLAGCAGNVRVKIDPSNPVYQPKNDFETNYGLIITTDERKIGYTIEAYPALSEPIKPFDEIDTLDEFRKFEKHFWDIRDTDPNTPQNEYKELIDSRLRDIQNEIFAIDLDTPGIRFDSNGGLKGDLAHVYLLHGTPTFKDKLSENTYHVEMVVWYYLDYEGRVLMSFLFYEKYNRLTVFRNQETAALDLEYVLKEISRDKFMSDEELQTLWYDLEREDPRWLFRSAMFRFSDYDRLDKDTRWTIDKALEPPEPAALTAKRFKPTILGQPDDLEGREFVFSGYHSFIPAKFDVIVDPDMGNPSFSITIAFSALDWEIKGQEAEAYLELRISFQNKETRTLKEFQTPILFRGPQQAVRSLIRGKDPKTGEPYSRTVELDKFLNQVNQNGSKATLRQLIDGLEPGDYVVNAYLRHAVTKKYNAWRDEIKIDN